MLVIEGTDGSWAWSGVRIAPALGSEATGAYTDLPESERQVAASFAERAWLQSVASAAPLGLAAPHGLGRFDRSTSAPDWPDQPAQPGHPEPDSQPVFAVRYTNERLDGLLDTYLLCRTEGPSAAAAAASTAALQSRLAALPSHVRGLRLASPDEVTVALRPFEPHPSGLAAIHKRITGAPASRPDTRRAVCLAIASFGAAAQSWEPMWAALARLPFRASVTVALAPSDLDPRLTARFTQLAEEYAYLAIPGRSATAIYDKPYAADQFAVRAAPAYADAARRYVGRVFTYCITVATEHEMPPMLAESLAALISGAAVLRPTSPGDWQAIRNDVASLNLDQMPTAVAQGIPDERVGPIERVLSGLADLDEATAAFRLPFQIPGHKELFRGFTDKAAAHVPPQTPVKAPSGDPWLAKRRFG